jgi:hypothetical protein
VLTAGLAVALEIRQIYRTVGLLKPGWMTVISTRCHGGCAGHRFHFRVRVCRDSKAVRFNDHLPEIRNKHIHLPEFAIWREAFVAEIVAFPGEFDDQIDAMTLYLDFMDTDSDYPAVAKARAAFRRQCVSGGVHVKFDKPRWRASARDGSPALHIVFVGKR